MTENNQTTDIHILDYLNVLVERRWMIVRNVLVAAVLVAALSFILPSKYQAVTTLMPPQEKSKSPISSLMSDVSSLGVNLPMETSSSELMVEILKSRSVWQRVLTRTFHCDGDTLPLWQLEGYESVPEARRGLSKKVSFNANEQGLITVAVELGDRQLAADAANAFVDALDAVNQQKSVSRAKNSRLYIEEQLDETREQLTKATEKLATFQQEHKAVSLEAQMEAGITQAGELKAMITAREVELSVMRESMKAENPVVQRKQNELEALKKRYRELQYGDQSLTQSTEFYLPFADVPEVALQLAELTREVKVQEKVWELLNQQFYQAKIEEARNMPTVQVLDEAEPPALRSKPQRKLLVIVFALLALVLSIIWAFWQHYLERLQALPEDQAKIQQMKNAFSEDRQRLRQFFRKK